MTSSPDFTSAINYALQELQDNLPTNLTYHTYRHTAEDVMPAATRLARHTGLPPMGIHLLEVAAAFHDLGFLFKVEGHEEESVRIVGEQLPHFGFVPVQISHIQQTIMATKLPQSPQDLAGQLLADADLDLLGREDFWSLSDLLQDETSRLGSPTTSREWHEKQLAFLTEHRYFTAAAARLRNKQKAKNVEKLRQLVA